VIVVPGRGTSVHILRFCAQGEGLRLKFVIRSRSFHETCQYVQRPMNRMAAGSLPAEDATPQFFYVQKYWT